MYPTVPAALQAIAVALESGAFEDATAFGRSRAQSAAAALRIAAREYDNALPLRHAEHGMLVRLLADSCAPGGRQGEVRDETVIPRQGRRMSDYDRTIDELRSRVVNGLKSLPRGAEADARRAQIARAYAEHAGRREHAVLGTL